MKEELKHSVEKSTIKSVDKVNLLYDQKFKLIHSFDQQFSNIWHLEDYGLDKSDIVSKISDDKKRGLLGLLAKKRLNESINIEKAGMSFSGKMSLLAKTINEQKLYSCFAQEEATHFSMFEALLGEHIELEDDDFIKFLKDLIVNGHRQALIFIGQIVLEGWGLIHYQSLSKSCLNLDVKKVLDQIIQDEGVHHSSGLSLFNEKELSHHEINYIVDMMSRFLQMVAVGPVSVMSSVLETMDGLHSSHIEQLLIDIKAEESTHFKLNLVRGFIVRSGARKILEQLDKKKCFQPVLMKNYSL